MSRLKKYELTNETIEVNGRTLHRIKALKDFSDVKKGDLGGYIEKEDNLSQDGNCWVYDNAKVFDNAYVYEYAMIYDNAKVFDNAYVYEYAMIYGNAEVYGNAKVYKGTIIGKVSVPYKDIFQYQCENRLLTAILTEDDKILYSIGCQNNISKEVFLDRIYNENGGLEKNPHRNEYLKLIPLIESYFKMNRKKSHSL